MVHVSEIWFYSKLIRRWILGWEIEPKISLFYGLDIIILGIVDWSLIYFFSFWLTCVHMIIRIQHLICGRICNWGYQLFAQQRERLCEDRRDHMGCVIEHTSKLKPYLMGNLGNEIWLAFLWGSAWITEWW